MGNISIEDVGNPVEKTTGKSDIGNHCLLGKRPSGPAEHCFPTSIPTIRPEMYLCVRTPP